MNIGFVLYLLTQPRPDTLPSQQLLGKRLTEKYRNNLLSCSLTQLLHKQPKGITLRIPVMGRTSDCQVTRTEKAVEDKGKNYYLSGWEREYSYLSQLWLVGLSWTDWNLCCGFCTGCLWQKKKTINAYCSLHTPKDPVICHLIPDP